MQQPKQEQGIKKEYERKEQERTKLYKKTLQENFEIYKAYFSDNKNVLNDPLIKIIKPFVDNNILFDLDFFWLEAYVDYTSLCQTDSSKNHPCYRLLVNMFHSSLMAALKRENEIDFPSKEIILETLQKLDYETIIVNEKKAREEESMRLMDELKASDSQEEGLFQ